MRGRSLLAAGLAVVLSLVVVGVFYGIRHTNSPEFCESCHIIKPYKDAWAKSSMGSSRGPEDPVVNCIDCHFEPGVIGYARGKIYSLMKLAEYGTRDFDRPPPSAELLTNSSCLQCHEPIADEEDPGYPGELTVVGGIDFVVKTDDGLVRVDGLAGANASTEQYQFDVAVDFPHDFHVNEAQKKCAECHGAVVHGTELVKTPQAARDPEYCSNCHDGDTAPIIFGEVELTGREHPGAPKVDTAIWKNQHWRLAKGPSTMDGGEMDEQGNAVVYEQIEKQTCLACHDEPEEAKGCKSCHFPSVPSFAPSNDAQAASAAPLTMFGFIIGTFLLTMVPYTKVKRYIFEGWLAVVIGALVLATDVYALVIVFREVFTVESGSRVIGPVALWIAYLMASASLLIFLFHQGVLKPRRRRLSGDE